MYREREREIERERERYNIVIIAVSCFRAAISCPQFWSACRATRAEQSRV